MNELARFLMGTIFLVYMSRKIHGLGATYRGVACGQGFGGECAYVTCTMIGKTTSAIGIALQYSTSTTESL